MSLSLSLSGRPPSQVRRLRARKVEINMRPLIAPCCCATASTYLVGHVLSSALSSSLTRRERVGPYNVRRRVLLTPSVQQQGLSDSTQRRRASDQADSRITAVVLPTKTVTDDSIDCDSEASDTGSGIGSHSRSLERDTSEASLRSSAFVE